jgi:ankyrin repeat protein
MRRSIVFAALAVLWPSLASAGQTTAAGTVDFERDVKPILVEKCTGCHGATQQQAGLRLDVGRLAKIGSFENGVVIVPGNSARSRLVWRITGRDYGPQMPPTGALKPEQIETIKRWIDQGAVWPGAERTAHASDVRVERLGSAFRLGDRAAIARAAADAAAVNLTGPDGMTPLMYAALYGTAADVTTWLDRGANPNARSDAGLTALMLAALDGSKVRALLAKGANPNLRSENGRTALHVAAERGALDVVKQLLAAGASVNFNGGDSPLALAAATGNVDLVHALVEAGAPVTRQAGVYAMVNAAVVECSLCIDVLAAEAEPVALGMALDAAANASSVAIVKQLLDKGAPIEAKDLFGGASPLIMAVISDRDALAKAKLLLDKGADAAAKAELGETALDFARRRGDRMMIELLEKATREHDASAPAPASPGAHAPAASAPYTAATLAGRIEKAMALLQPSDDRFVKNTGCISCHHQVLPEVLAALAERKHVQMDAAAAARQARTLASYVEDRRPQALQGLEIPGGPDTLSYLMFALDAQGYAPTETTDAWARYLMMLQQPEGRWRITINRPPLESSDIEVTALSLRALARYAPASDRAFYQQRVRAAGAWLANAPAATNEDRVYRLLGLAWAGAPPAAVAGAVRDLRAAQRSDGGWAQIDGRESDAYATGQALYALHEAGHVLATDPAYKRGVQYLLDTQHDDGSWLVTSRSVPLQPLFESGFPHGRDQWISAAGTSWAAIALTLALP